MYNISIPITPKPAGRQAGPPEGDFDSSPSGGREVNNYGSLLFMTLIILFSSCELEVDIEMPEHTPVLVANCLFTADSTFSVHVSHSVGMTSGEEIKNIENATVEIYEGGNFIGNLVHNYLGFYANTVIKATQEKPYEIRVSAPGYASVTANDTIPVPLHVTLVQVKDSVIEMTDNMQQYYTEVTIAIPDPANKNNYYSVEIFIQDSMKSYINKLALTSADPASEQTGNMDLSLKFSDALFSGRTYNFSFRYQDYYLNPGDTVYLSFYSLSRAYYLYSKTKALFDITGFNPFAEPVQVFSNAEGGLGIFAGKSSYTMVIKY